MWKNLYAKEYSEARGESAFPLTPHSLWPLASADEDVTPGDAAAISPP